MVKLEGKTTKLSRYWYWYWVILGCFRDFGIGIAIVKDFLKILVLVLGIVKGL